MWTVFLIIRLAVVQTTFSVIYQIQLVEFSDYRFTHFIFFIWFSSSKFLFCLWTWSCIKHIVHWQRSWISEQIGAISIQESIELFLFSLFFWLDMAWAVFLWVKVVHWIVILLKLISCLKPVSRLDHKVDIESRGKGPCWIFFQSFAQDSFPPTFFSAWQLLCAFSLLPSYASSHLCYLSVRLVSHSTSYFNMHSISLHVFSDMVSYKSQLSAPIYFFLIFYMWFLLLLLLLLLCTE